MDMNNDAGRSGSSLFNDQSQPSGQSTAFSGLPEQSGGLGTRSIWSSGTSSLPPPMSQTNSQQRPTSGQQTTRVGAQTASAEALFNSMPNHNQQTTGSNRSSPNMPGAAMLDPLKRNAFASTEASTAAHAAQPDIWNPPSPRGVPKQDARLHQGAIRGPYQQTARQYG